MSLKEYKNKRNFNKTSEPVGTIKNLNKAATKSNKITTKNSNKKLTNFKKDTQNKKLIFVIQHHFARREHFDFRLEHNGVLLSWAVPKGLSNQLNEKRLAVHVEDHPLEYAQFEGIIPKGNYGAGSVEIFDSGFYIPSYDFDYGMKKGHLKFVLFGNIYKGEFSLVKLDEKNWLIIKGKDEFAKTDEKNLKNNKITSQNTKNLKKISKNLKTENNLPFNKCEVQLATLTNKIPSGKNWLYEIKYDGYRMLAYKQNGEIKIFSRNNKDYTNKFKPLIKSLKKIDAQSFVLDGEVVAFDITGKSNFSLLLERMKMGGEISYMLFDILALNGQDLRHYPLLQRKQILKELLVENDENLMFSEFLLNKGKQCFKFAKQHNLEGIVAKDINSIYAGKRNESWLKIKCYMRQEFVICGFTKTDKNAVLSALLLGFYNNKKLQFVGKVGTGFNEQEKQILREKLNKILTDAAPFNLKTNEQIFWVKPKLVAEIQFAELTKDNILRQPSFVGLREDKLAKDVKLEVATNG